MLGSLFPKLLVALAFVLLTVFVPYEACALLVELRVLRVLG
jgi:hypothetical protein